MCSWPKPWWVPLLNPQAPGVWAAASVPVLGACSFCAWGSPPVLGASSGAGHLAIWRPTGVGRPLCPILAATLPPALRSALPVPPKAASSSPCVPRGAGGNGGLLELRAARRLGSGEQVEQRLARRQPLGKGAPHSVGPLWSLHLSVFQEPVFVGGDPPLPWPCRETAIPAQGRPLAPVLRGELQQGKGPGPGWRKDLPGSGTGCWGGRWSRSGMGKDGTLSPHCISKCR